MGQDKALLEYKGAPLIDHMMGLLRQTGIQDVYVSGRTGETCASAGCRCLQDSTPFSGPAAAVHDVLGRLSDYKGVLFVPVDMPFLTPEVLGVLLRDEKSSHYEGWPLPLYLRTNEKPGSGASVKQMLDAMTVKIWPVPREKQPCFANINTPEDWKDAVQR